jgi:hypothetical protein
MARLGPRAETCPHGCTGPGSVGGDNTALLDAVAVAPAGGHAAGDPGFEQPSVGPAGAYGSFAHDPAGTPWSFAGQAAVSPDGSGLTSGNPAAPQGSQVGFLQGTGSFSQAVGGWAGGSYVISFDAAQRGNSGGSNEDFQVLVDGTVVGTFTPSGTSYQTYTTDAFIVAAGAHTIVFQGLDTAGGGNTSFLDEIRLTTD